MQRKECEDCEPVLPRDEHQCDVEEGQSGVPGSNLEGDVERDEVQKAWLTGGMQLTCATDINGRTLSCSEPAWAKSEHRLVAWGAIPS